MTYAAHYSYRILAIVSVGLSLIMLCEGVCNTPKGYIELRIMATE